MSRKKTAKRNAKTPTTNKAFATVQQIEKEFHQVPGQLAGLLNKEIVSLKQQESKLKAALNKASAQVKHSQAQIKSAEKNKHTAAGKKQINAAKKALATASKLHTSLTKELTQLAKTLEAHNTHQAKMNALRKHLSQFGKIWASLAKKAKAKAKPKAKAKSAKRNTAKKQPHNITPITAAESQMPSYESAIEDSYEHEVSESTA